MPDKSVELRLILSGIFLMNDFFDKCSAVSICAPFSGYGQNAFFEIYPEKPVLDYEKNAFFEIYL